MQTRPNWRSRQHVEDGSLVYLLDKKTWGIASTWQEQKFVLSFSEWDAVKIAQATVADFGGEYSIVWNYKAAGTTEFKAIKPGMLHLSDTDGGTLSIVTRADEFARSVTAFHLGSRAFGAVDHFRPLCGDWRIDLDGETLWRFGE